MFAQSAGAVEYTNHLCRGVRPPNNECPDYDTKQSDSEVPILLELWGMQSPRSTQAASLQRGQTPHPMSVLNMALKNLIVRFQ